MLTGLICFFWNIFWLLGQNSYHKQVSKLLLIDNNSDTSMLVQIHEFLLINIGKSFFYLLKTFPFCSFGLSLRFYFDRNISLLTLSPLGRKYIYYCAERYICFDLEINFAPTGQGTFTITSSIYHHHLTCLQR